MSIKKIFFSATSALLVCNLFAQSFDFSLKERWSNKPALHSVKTAYAASSAVGIIDDRKIEYQIKDKDAFILHRTYKLIKINDDKGIEMYNKVYIPLYTGQEIMDIKARTIQKNGKIIDLPNEKIKTIEEDGKRYRLFAMEGVEKGAEVEYQYTIKKNISVFGTEIFQSTNIPIQEAFFTLITPENLKFDIKGYNGFAVSEDSVINGNRTLVGYGHDMADIDDEKYSMKDPLLQRVEYKLSYNLSNNKDVRLYTWKEFAKRAFTNYTSITNKEEKAVEGFMKKMPYDKAATEAERILSIEDYIKTNINSDEKIVGEDADNLETTIKIKNTNRNGIVKLFAAIFDKTSINYQIVFPSNRAEIPLDEDLENWRTIEEVLIYFPSTQKFINPYAADLRYPFVSARVSGTRGLFLKTTTIGSLKTAVGVFSDITMEPFDKHANNLDVSIKFDNTLDTVLLSSKQILLGYSATAYRPIYTYLPKDKQDETTKVIIKSVAKSENISNIKIENTNLNDLFYNKPLIISADIKSTEILEKAGQKILLKIGEVIGPQEEMYQEKPRQLPIELEYPHMLNRKIVLEIPRGFTIKNLKDLNINISYKDADGESTMGFVSSYEVNGDKVTISVEENYKQLKYDIKEFENFKKVINAAADFNKIVLVLEKN